MEYAVLFLFVVLVLGVLAGGTGSFSRAAEASTIARNARACSRDEHEAACDPVGKQ